MSKDLTDCVAIVTGAGSGIGRAIACTFAENGMKVVLAGRRRARLLETAEQIRNTGGTAFVMPVDVADQVLVEAMVERSLLEYGRIDVLYNNAGVMSDIGPLWEADLERWWAALEINVRGSMLCAKAVLPHMIERDSGIIINMSGGGAAKPLPGASGYACSKAAILRLTDTLAAELAMIQSAVRVYAMDPGFNPTEMTVAVAAQPKASQWVPFVGQRLANNEGHSPEECAQTSLDLIRIAPMELQGRTIVVGDDIEEMVNNVEKAKGEQRLLRLL